MHHHEQQSEKCFYHKYDFQGRMRKHTEVQRVRFSLNKLLFSFCKITLCGKGLKILNKLNKQIKTALFKRVTLARISVNSSSTLNMKTIIPNNTTNLGIKLMSQINTKDMMNLYFLQGYQTVFEVYIVLFNTVSLKINVSSYLSGSIKIKQFKRIDSI